MEAMLHLVDDEPKGRATHTLIKGMQAMAIEEEARHQAKLTQWQKDWDDIEANFQQQEQTAEVDKDVMRSGLLSTGLAEQLTTREMAKLAVYRNKKGTIKHLAQQHISRLLIYYRFNRLTPAGVKITEWRFREYWEAVRDPHATMGKRKQEDIAAYEAQVFPIIAAMIAAGEKPVPVKKPTRAPKEVKTVKQQQQYTQALREEIQGIYGRMKHDIHELKEIAGAERARLDPIWIANHATRLEKGFMELQKALKRDIGGLVA